MLSSTYYCTNDVMCGSLYGVNVYDVNVYYLILFLIKKTQQPPLHIGLQLALFVSRQNFHRYFPRRMSLLIC